MSWTTAYGPRLGRARETRRAAGERSIEAALELRTALEHNEVAMRQVSARLEAVGAESAQLLDRLKEVRDNQTEHGDSSRPWHFV